MHVFEMVVIITVVSIVAGVINKWLSNRKVPEVDLSEIEARLDNLEALKQRIEVLEAIVTDKGYDLKREIEGLR